MPVSQKIPTQFLISIVLFLGSVFFTKTFAQPNLYKFTHIDNTNGLSNNQVSYIYKDSNGFMWFCTMSGLNRYDGSRIKVFRHNYNDSLSICDNFVYKIQEDFKGNLVALTRNGISVYNPHTETFNNNLASYCKSMDIPMPEISNIYRVKSGNIWYVGTDFRVCKYDISSKKYSILKHNDTDSTTISNAEISFISEDSNGDCWITYKNGLIEKLSRNTCKVLLREYFLNKHYHGEIGDFTSFIDSDDDIWIYMPAKPDGAYYYQPGNRTFLHFTRDNPSNPLNNNIVVGITEDNTGKIWLATDHGGINIISKPDFRVIYIMNNPEDQRSLSQNSITSVYKDDSGIIWLGTFKKGISYYNENIIRFKLLKHQTSNPQSLGFDDVNCFTEDDLGNIWIGTNGGGLIYYDRKRETFKEYRNIPGDPSSLSNNIIVSLWIDHEKKLWVGTYYGGLNCFANGKFAHYKHDENNSGSISDDRIWEIYEDRSNNLWIGTLGGGLNLFDRKKNTFTHFRAGAPNSIHSDYISSFLEDKNGNLWIGTAHGIDVRDPLTGKFTHISNNPDDHKSLSNNNVIDIIEDSRGKMWVGTREGLNLYDAKTRSFRIFRENNGLPSNTILTLLEDKNGNLWMGTPNGLSNLIISNIPGADSTAYIFKNYDESDGLQGKEFNENAALKTHSGELLFGGTNGFNIFKPEDIKVNLNLPKVVLTDLQIFNKSIKPTEKFDGRYILKDAISETKEITLKYSENIISIEFAALSYFHPEKNKYQYKLEGFNENWLTTDENLRKAVYTNLNPGTYTFRVKASNNDGIWNKNGASLIIRVLPPFWKTKTAILFYILFVVGLLAIARKMLLERARLKFNLEQERTEAIRRHELDMMKIKFFTNISHEFRTPLSLILAPIDKLLVKKDDSDTQKQLTTIQRNAKRLLNLVNQLLDFRRMEVKELTLNPSPGNIIDFIKEATFSFSDLSDKKNIRFTFSTNVQELNTFFDHDKLEKIIFNLLSNAFKFTPENGSVSVETGICDESMLTKNELPVLTHRWIFIKVTDTGIGIEKDKHQKIFERFFQNEVPGSMLNQGSGIGLSLTSEFVKLHNGIIEVESEPESGTCFTVLLPAKEIESLVIADDVQHENVYTGNGAPAGEHPEINNKKPTLLLVDDNEDFRFYLKDNLKNFYNITDAPNGSEALKKAVTLIPDLIVSDVMMPVMDGIEFCKKIKSDRRTSHIPVILLTAKVSDEQKLEGFETGADEYITKPFNFEILQSRIKNLISQREKMRNGYLKQIEIKPSEINVVSLDEKIIKKAIDLVEKNISNADFSVEELSRELGMSRVHLYKKLLSLTGKTPIEFIRTIRLKRAAQLLGKSQLTVSEIAYQVGFNNPKYFTKYFKAEFNILPSQYSAEHQPK